MNDHRDKMRTLVEAARRARPDDRTRQRIRAGIDARLAAAAAVGAVATAMGGAAVAAETAVAGSGAAAAAAASTTTAASTTATTATIAGGGATGAAAVLAGKSSLFGLATKVGLAVGLLAVGAAGVREFVRSRNEPIAVASVGTTASPGSPASEPPTTTSTAMPVDTAAPLDTASADEAAAPTSLASGGRAPELGSPASARRDAASIAAEVALLRKAQASLREGDGAASLEAIDALAAKHPDGALREERDAARVLALCAAGRVDDARAEALRFLARWPRSLQAARVRASCAFAKNDAKTH